MTIQKVSKDTSSPWVFQSAAHEKEFNKTNKQTQKQEQKTSNKETNEKTSHYLQQPKRLQPIKCPCRDTPQTVVTKNSESIEYIVSK